jgi:hypothetical protein
MHGKARIKKTLLITAVTLLLATAGSGCGRTLPAIDAATLEARKAALVLTGASLTPEETEEIRQAAGEKAAADKIALEFVVNTSTNPDELASIIGKGKYDSIIGAGSELAEPLSKLAAGLPESRFVVLGNGVNTAVPESMPANLMIKRLDDAHKTRLWDNWVQLQKASGLAVLWIQRTGSPVPAEWSPSEEADKLLSLDIYPGDTWFPQLTYQVSAVKPSMIALYTAVDDAVMAKIKTLKLPVVDTVGGLSAQYRWGTILPVAITASLDDGAKGGIELYTAEEAVINRK